MRRRRFIGGATALAALAVAAYVFAELFPDAPLQIGVALVLTFLIVLVARYGLLLWLAYLHHIESRGAVSSDGPAPRVTIIVPVYNEATVIVAALRSLLALRYPAFDILVVDDGSTDQTFERATSLQGRYGAVTLRVVRKLNGGKASALNTGLALAKTPFVLCMDGDSRLTPDTLWHAMRHFADPRVAAVAGNVKVVNRNNMWTRLQALEYVEGLNLARRAQGYLHAVNIIPGPIGVFRRDVLLGVGAYDTDTFAEDADLTLKILTRGWHIVYEDRAIAWTEAPEKYLDLIKQRYRWTRGILQALGKHGASLTGSRQSAVVRLSLLAMFFEALLWPAVNVLGNLLFVVAALGAGDTSGVVYWWGLLTALDVAAALYTVAMEEEDLALVPYAVIYRLFFIAMVDVAKLFAAVEQLANVEMTWGKLERAGRI
jgi:cellulose synthase/poly-beta-1,6-N-acetylglucosamine synthase-like glycosyltransferase